LCETKPEKNSSPFVFVMALRLTNTLTRRTEPFTPLRPGKASIYCCGVTVYDLCHLGHARSYINWDVLRRYLIWCGLEVSFVQNFTDIDDKILKRASDENSSMTAVSERNIDAFHTDMDSLGILRPDSMPRATQCLDGIRALIGELEAKGAAYSAEGDVYFAVMKHAGYGKLSGRDLSEQQENAGGRVADAEGARKQHPFDFALWKSAKEGEPSFPSPWGAGRPGWHIECSAMVRAELGDTIDIHLGGADLVFPHHENEIAQSEAATGQELAQVWMHNGMVNVGGQKMSKSLGNFTTIRALLESGVSPMTLRLFVLQAHYRKPLDFTAEALEAAATGWKGLNAALGLGERHGQSLEWPETPALAPVALVGPSSQPSEPLETLQQRFIEAMDDDLNSSGALAVLFDLAKPLRALANRLERGDRADRPADELAALALRWRLLRDLAAVLGLRCEADAETSGPGDDTTNQAEIQAAIDARIAAKSAKNYAEADRIRDELKAQGIELIDKPGGITEWIRR
jgi:cysteinyl-tRNA synthetase